MAKILFVAGTFNSLFRFRGALLSELARRGQNSIVACAAISQDPADRPREIAGVRYVALPMKRASLSVISDVLFFFRLLLLIRREKPDYFFGYTAKPVIYGLLASVIAGVKKRYALITGLGYAFIDLESRKRRCLNSMVSLLYRLALRWADVVFFQNPDDLDLFVQRKLLSNSARAKRVWGSGVDLDYYAAVPIPTSPPVFLMIARLLKDKGIYEYVDACRRLRAKYPIARCCLVGPVDPNPASISLASVEQWAAEGDIEYLGATEDVRPFIAKSSVFVLPSYREGTPRTVLEAMAMGRPIITTDAPGCRETVFAGQNGFLVPVRDPGALAEAMEKFIVTPGLAIEMGKRGRQLAEKHYDVVAVNREIMEAMGFS